MGDSCSASLPAVRLGYRLGVDDDRSRFINQLES
jgi:hypothetical protein